MKNKQLKKDFVWNMLGLTINSFNSLFFLVIINWINGRHDGGIFTFSFSLCCLLYFVGTFYNRTYQISNPNKFTNKEFIMNRVISVLIMLGLTICYALIMKYEIYKFSIILGLCFYKMLESFAEVMYGIETENDELYKSGISMFIKGVLSIILFLVIDLITKNLLLSVSIIVLVNIFVILVYDIPNCKKYITSVINYKNVLRIFKFTLPIFVFCFLNNYLINSSKYILDVFETAETQNLFGIILMPGTIMGLCTGYILNPYLVKLKKNLKDKKYDNFDKTIGKIVLSIILLGIFIIVCAYLFGIKLMGLVYHIDLSPYATDIIIIIAGSIFLSITIIYSNVLTIMNKNITQMILYIINSIISLVISIILIKNYGLFGATLTYLIIMVLQGIEFVFAYKILYKKLEV